MESNIKYLENLCIYKDFRDDVINCIQSLHSTKKILDVGCGDGALITKLVNLGYECTGTEIIDEQVMSLKNSGLDVFNLSATNMSIFKDKAFDCVILANVIHHVSQRTIAMSECFRVSKKYIIVLESFADTSIEFQNNSLKLDLELKALQDAAGIYHHPHYNTGEVLGACASFFDKIESFKTIIMNNIEELPKESVIEWVTALKDTIGETNANEIMLKYRKKNFCKFGLQINMITLSCSKE